MSAREILRNNVKEELARGEVIASMTVRLSRSAEIARIAKTAGFVRMGARYVSTGTDLGFLLDAASARAKGVREMAGST